MGHDEQIAQLETQIAEIKARLPKHSVPPAMIFRLEELEDELRMARRERDSEPNEGQGREHAPSIAL